MKKALMIFPAIMLLALACMTARHESGRDGTGALPAGNDAEARASVNGKYAGLIQKVHCPGDVKQYGQFNDYGHWTGSSYCGQQVSPGFWVYVSPDWYVWRTQADLPRPDGNLATVNGKYSGLIQAVLCPGDRGQYGEFHDYGYWADSPVYCGQQVSGGYWVYRHPYWYIWRESLMDDRWK